MTHTKVATLLSVIQQSTKNNNSGTNCDTKYKFHLKPLQSYMTVYTDNCHLTEHHFVTVPCKQVDYIILNGNSHPTVHTTVCAASNTTH
jgi:hypothetical protein